MKMTIDGPNRFSLIDTVVNVPISREIILSMEPLEIMPVRVDHTADWTVLQQVLSRVQQGWGEKMP